MGVCTSQRNNLTNIETQNYRKYFSNQSMCYEIGIIVMGFIRRILAKHNSIHIHLPSEIQTLCTLYFGSVHGNLVVENGQTLQLNDFNHQRFEYDSILLKKNATLTINRWNSRIGFGGLLYIICNGDITLQEGATINLNGKGYYGGQYGRNGETYHINGKSIKTTKPNYSGGGAGALSLQFGARTSRGGGGGYGSIGFDGKYIDENDNDNDNNNNCKDNSYGIGGAMYGDKHLNILHLGSGGGSGYYFEQMGNTLAACAGGSGGGALKLQCFGDIIMTDSRISCNGAKGANGIGGAGSGGSIHIIVGSGDNLKIDKHSRIEALGGINMNNSGNGGDGRIKIEFIHKNLSNKLCYNINPKAYMDD